MPGPPPPKPGPPSPPHVYPTTQVLLELSQKPVMEWETGITQVYHLHQVHHLLPGLHYHLHYHLLPGLHYHLPLPSTPGLHYHLPQVYTTTLPSTPGLHYHPGHYRSISETGDEMGNTGHLSLPHKSQTVMKKKTPHLALSTKKVQIYGGPHTYTFLWRKCLRF